MLYHILPLLERLDKYMSSYSKEIADISLQSLVDSSAYNDTRSFLEKIYVLRKYRTQYNLICE